MKYIVLIIVLIGIFANLEAKNNALINDDMIAIPVQYKNVDRLVEESGLEFMIGGNALDMSDETGLELGIICYKQMDKKEFGIFKELEETSSVHFIKLRENNIPEDATVFVIFWNKH